MPPRIRREQVCSRCRNHGKTSLLKNHKKFCPFLACECAKCSETRERQQFIAREIRFHRKRLKEEKIPALKKVPSLKLLDSDAASATCEVRRHQMCARCRNHGQFNAIKGHKNNCQFVECACEKCLITEERRKIMAKQIRENRSNKVYSDDDEGYSGSPPTGSEGETEAFKFPTVVVVEGEEREGEMPQLQRLEEPTVSSQLVSDEKEVFYIVQSLYEKCFLHGDSKSQLEVLYAFAMLSRGNWPIINQSLVQGSQLAGEQVDKHLKMARFHQYLLSQSSEVQQQQQQQVRLKVMGGKF